MNELTRLVNNFLSQGMRNEREITHAVISEILEANDPVDLLYPVICHIVAHQRRAHVRRLEQEAAPFLAPEPAMTAGSGGPVVVRESAALQSRHDLLLERVFVPGDGFVLWGELTVVQHLAIIEFYQNRIRGYEFVISRHQEAIEAILARDVSCLNEIS